MLKRIAALIDHSITRVVLSLMGLVVTILFGLIGVLLLTSPGWWWLFSLGGVLGLVGWWGRVFLPITTLSSARILRSAILALLLIGIGTTFCALAIFPGSHPWYVVLSAIAAMGMLLALGTLAAWQTGPNNSFKPNPLRGSA